MKTLRNITIVFAMMAMIPLQVFAQKNEGYICYDTDCMFKVLTKMISQDDAEAAEAIVEFSQIVDNYRFTGDGRIREALVNSAVPFAGKFSNVEIMSYVISYFPTFCNERDIEELMRLIEHERIADQVIRAIGDIHNSKDYVLKYLVKNSNDIKYKGAWAYAIGKQHITDMEDTLISWLKGDDDMTKVDIYNALLVVGSNDKTTAIVRKGAKKLNKSKNWYCKIAGMRLLVALDGEKMMPELYKALKIKNSDVRKEALKLMEPYANQEVVDKVMKLTAKKTVSNIEVVEWLGNIKNDSQMPFVIRQLSSKDKTAVETAIRAIFKIDNPAGINAVKPLFGGEYQDVIKELVIAYEGNYDALLNDVLRSGTDNQRLAALQILECRPTIVVCSSVKDLLNTDNQVVRDYAYRTLKLVVTAPQMEFLVRLLETCDERYVDDVLGAIKNATVNLPDEKKDYFASTLKHVKPDVMPRYYKVFAYFGTELCVEKLIDAYQNGNYQFEAKEALMLVNNKQFEERIKEVLK